MIQLHMRVSGPDVLGAVAAGAACWTGTGKPSGDLDDCALAEVIENAMAASASAQTHLRIRPTIAPLMFFCS